MVGRGVERWQDLKAVRSRHVEVSLRSSAVAVVVEHPCCAHHQLRIRERRDALAALRHTRDVHHETAWRATDGYELVRTLVRRDTRLGIVTCRVRGRSVSGFGLRGLRSS